MREGASRSSSDVDELQTGASLTVLAMWQERAVNVRGRAINRGQFLPEEAPEETTSELLAFLSGR